MQPIGSVALAALIFGESPSALQLVGVVVVLCALLVSSLPEQVFSFGAKQRRGAGAVVGAHVALGAADEHDGL
jgi:drug/metabolite transporter (DMT)-like permease